jgi:hypothetical protein
MGLGLLSRFRGPPVLSCVVGCGRFGKGMAVPVPTVTGNAVRLVSQSSKYRALPAVGG